MDIDQEAKYRLLDMWCEKHQLPADINLHNPDDDMSDEDVFICSECMKELQETSERFRRSLTGFAQELGEPIPDLSINGKAVKRIKQKYRRTNR